MDVAIVKYNAGNIFSVVNAFKRLGIEPILTSDPAVLQRASHVVFLVRAKLVTQCRIYVPQDWTRSSSRCNSLFSAFALACS